MDETIARDIDELNGDALNLMEITQEERDHQMRDHTQNADHKNYTIAASKHWRKICLMYRAKAKSLKKKLSLLDRRGIDENGDFTPMKLCSHFSRNLQEVSCIVVVNVVVLTKYFSRNSKMRSRHRAATGTTQTISLHKWKLRYLSTGHIG